MKSKRFEILDFYRFIAILMVMIYHYFTRWSIPHFSVDLYPYKGKYDHFLWGRLGVQFFYIISGFVISMTLEHSSSLVDFAKKRLLRLLPSMILISSITFIIFSLFDTNFIFIDSHSFSNLLYSWTFLGKAMNTKGYSFIDGSYWSLWVEVQFYLLAGILFYVLKQINNLKAFSFVLFIIALFFDLGKPFLYEVNQTFNLTLYFNFFVIGVLIKELFKSNNPWSKSSWYWHAMLAILLFLECLLFSDDRTTIAINILFISLFYFFLYSSKKQWVPNNILFKYLVYLGEASYLSYLLHQNIGVLIINKLNYNGPFDYIVPILIIIIVFLSSALLYSYVEKPIMHFLKNKLFGSR